MLMTVSGIPWQRRGFRPGFKDIIRSVVNGVIYEGLAIWPRELMSGPEKGRLGFNLSISWFQAGGALPLSYELSSIGFLYQYEPSSYTVNAFPWELIPLYLMMGFDIVALCYQKLILMKLRTYPCFTCILSLTSTKNGSFPLSGTNHFQTTLVFAFNQTDV